jgi:hypothetical protein
VTIFIISSLRPVCIPQKYSISAGRNYHGVKILISYTCFLLWAVSFKLTFLAALQFPQKYVIKGPKQPARRGLPGQVPAKGEIRQKIVRQDSHDENARKDNQDSRVDARITF